MLKALVRKSYQGQIHRDNLFDLWLKDSMHKYKDSVVSGSVVCKG